MPGATRASAPVSGVSGGVAPAPDVSLAWRAESGLMAGNFAGLGKAYGRCRARRTITTAACMHNRPTAYQPRSKHKHVFLLLGVLIVLAVLGGGYLAFWRHVARQLEAGVEAW